MKKYALYILILIVLVGLFSSAFSIHASEANPNEACNDKTNPTNKPCVQPYVLLAPLPGAGGQPTSEVNPGAGLGAYLNLMIKIIIGLAAVLAVIMIVMGGLEYMTSELISSKEEGKKRILGAIFGLLLALGAYALLFTINPDLLSTNVNIQQATIIVDIKDNVAQTPVNGRYTNSNLNYTVNEVWAPRAGPLADLTYSGASVYNSQCATVGQTNCTSTRGLNPGTLNTIHQKCSACVLSIQGGTEFWAHGGETGSTSHGIGSPTVDLGVNTNLTNYITGGQALVPNKRYDKDGISYRYEVNHWHAGP